MGADFNAADGGSSFSEFAFSHGAVTLGMVFLAATTGFDVHHLLMDFVVEPTLG